MSKESTITSLKDYATKQKYKKLQAEMRETRHSSFHYTQKALTEFPELGETSIGTYEHTPKYITKGNLVEIFPEPNNSVPTSVNMSLKIFEMIRNKHCV